MVLTGHDITYDPQTLNLWLKGHEGFVNDSGFVWDSVDSLGLTYKGKITNCQIGS
jgi:hypothetical protein